jgi:nitrogen regulatory protein PII
MAGEMVLVIFNSSIEDEMMEALKRAGMTCYTKFANVQGVGSCSDPRLDCHVWPGTNTMFLICVDPESKEKILQSLRKLKEIHSTEGVKAFVLPITSSI